MISANLKALIRRAPFTKWMASSEVSEGGLAQRVARGGVWVGALRVVNRGVSFVRTIVLARLLAPEDFGLMGVAMLTLSTLGRFSETGISAALIQRKDDAQPYLDTAWTLQVGRGVVLATVLVAGAPLASAFFGEGRATALIRVLALSVLTGSLANIGIVSFRRDLEFHKQFLYDFAATLADLLVVIPLALLLRNVWALVGAALVKAMAQLILSYTIHDYRPSLRLEWGRAKELLSFGRWILGSSIVIFLLTQGDDILLGKILGTSALGLYQMAYTISNMPATEISHVVFQVAFPTFSRLQDNQVRLRQAFLFSTQLIASVTIPLAAGIAALAPGFVQFVLGSQWLPMVSTIRILCLYGALRSISYGSLYQAVGRPQLLTHIALAKLAILAVVIYPMTRKWGMDGTALAIVISDFPLEVIAAKKAMEITRLSWSRFLEILGMPALAVLPMVGAVLLVRTACAGFVGWLLAALCAGLTLVLALFLIDSLNPRYNLVALLRRIWVSL